jgi:hypothetical protein
MSANLAAAKGIEPCPMCGSDQVRWRKRRPTDFVLNTMRAFVEWLWSGLSFQARVRYRQNPLIEQGYVDPSTADVPEVALDAREASTGHRTPRRFWRCKACNREGHVF